MLAGGQACLAGSSKQQAAPLLPRLPDLLQVGGTHAAAGRRHHIAEHGLALRWRHVSSGGAGGCQVLQYPQQDAA